MDPEKKISFGFSKSNKKPSAIHKPENKKVDYVVSLEGYSLKLKDEPKEVKKGPLVIPLKDNKKDLLDKLKDMKAKKNNSKNEKEPVEDTRPDSELTIDELAAREVVRDAKLKLAQSDTKENKIFVVPMNKEGEPLLEGEKESTLTDYENIPVSDFGLAMLRGMGWKEGTGIGKNPTKIATSLAPELRPKGLGLGASITVNSQTQNQPVCDTDGKTLVLKKGCYAKIIAGNNKGNYCEVQGLDDESGRIVVKTSLKGDILALNEFLLIPVTNEEYSRNSKVINSDKFKEYKEMEEKKINIEKVEAESKNVHVNTKEDPNKYSEREKSSNTHLKLEKSEEIESPLKTHYSSDSDKERSRRIHRRKDKRRHRDKSRSPYKTKYKSSRKSSKTKHRHRSTSSDSSEYERKKSRHRRSRSNNNEGKKRRNKK